jgi:hypothetical protein
MSGMEAWVVDDASKGNLDTLLKKVTVDADKVRAALSGLKALLPTDDEAPTGTLEQWRMEEVQLTLEISGEGGVRLVGSATLGVTGGIKVKFVRRA